MNEETSHPFVPLRGGLSSRRKIAIVEDDHLIADDLAHLLRTAGYEVAPPIPSGEKAIEFIQKDSAVAPDLVLMDIALGTGIDGIDAAHRIKAHTNVPILYMTAHFDTATLERAELTDPFGYITKPFHERDVAIAVGIAIHRHDVEQDLAGKGERVVVICSHCRTLDDGNNRWLEAVSYLTTRLGIRLSHGICPECVVEYAEEFGYDS